MTKIAALAAALVAIVPTASAGFPGANGRIVFTQRVGPLDRHRPAESVLCSADTDGSHQSRLTEFGAAAGSPAFSPDGARLALVTAAEGVSNSLVVARSDGSGARTILRAGVETAAWSADGRHLYVALEGDLYAARTDDGFLTQLTSTADRRELAVAASPDGRLAYVESTSTSSTLVVADSQLRSPRALPTRDVVGAPDWSPDSRELVFARRDGIWAIAADGSALRRLRGSGFSPAYSPDGTRIVFADEGDVWTMTDDGSGAARVTETPTLEHSPAWQRAEAAVIAAGTRACAITGTAGNDVLVGSAGRDVFVDMPGNDVIRGLGGNDVVLDGPGDDEIALGDDGDAVGLGEGRNRVDGGAGDDVIGTLRGRVDMPQIIAGGDGFDRLSGGNAADTLGGGPGRDVLSGGGGADRLDGGRGRDELAGGAGNDVVLARDGVADRILGGGGVDRARADRFDRLRGVERVLRPARAARERGRKK